MNQYIERVKKELSEYRIRCHRVESESILNLLWQCYLESCPVDDGRIKAAESTIAPVFNELSNVSSDLLSDMINDLCTAYQRAAFLEGIQIGVHLFEELK